MASRSMWEEMKSFVQPGRRVSAPKTPPESQVQRSPVANERPVGRMAVQRAAQRPSPALLGTGAARRVGEEMARGRAKKLQDAEDLAVRGK